MVRYGKNTFALSLLSEEVVDAAGSVPPTRPATTSAEP
jgi:hypothetical protein